MTFLGKVNQIKTPSVSLDNGGGSDARQTRQTFTGATRKIAANLLENTSPEVIASNSSCASASNFFRRDYLSGKKRTALQVDDIAKQLKKIKTLEINNVLMTSDEGRVYSKNERFPTSNPQVVIQATKTINKTPDVGNTTLVPISGGTLSMFKKNKYVDRSYSITDLTFSAASAHYKRKDNIDMFSAGPLKNTTSPDQAKRLGESIADRLLVSKDKDNIGVSVDMETSSSSASHRISVALKKSKEDGSVTLVVHDSFKDCYQLWGHNERVESMLSGISEKLSKNPDSEKPPLTLITTDRNIQNDQYACGTTSIVALKELLKNDGALIDDMANKAREEKPTVTAGGDRVNVGLPPALYRMAQAPKEKITTAEKSAIFRQDKGKTVQDKLNEFNLPDGKVKFSVRRDSLPENWSEDDVSRTVGMKGYTQEKEGVYSKTVDDPQNGYLRAKSLAFAQLAIDTAKNAKGEGNPKQVLQSMFSKIHIPCPT